MRRGGEKQKREKEKVENPRSEMMVQHENLHGEIGSVGGGN